MSWEIWEDIVEKFTNEDTPIGKIKAANKKFEDMWYDEGTLDEDSTKKDYYDQLAKINSYELQWGRADKALKKQSRKNLIADLDKAHPDRAAGDIMGQLKSQKQSPHWEKGKPFVESDVTEAILEGKLKRPEPPYEGPFGKLGEYFSKNATARDKLFNYMSSMGKELVKPVQPGQEAAGALVPTLSRGITKGEESYTAKQAAAAKTALDIASAHQKISPLQYYSSKMSEARLAVPQGIDPDSAEGKRWIGKYLMSVGIPGQVVDLTSSLESLNLQLLSAPSDTEKKRIQGLIDQINRQLEGIISQSIGGSSVTSVIDYTTLAGT
jgi:hypothetical protein